MRVVAFLALAACSTTAPAADAGPRTCAIDLSGNRSGTSTAPSCASVARSDAGGEVLVIDAQTSSFGHLSVSIDLGASTSGTIASSGVGDWSATIVGNDDGGCVLAAGAATVPQGTFTLSGLVVPDAGPPSGTLDVVMAVQAATSVDCGPTDVEYVHVAF